MTEDEYINAQLEICRQRDFPALELADMRRLFDEIYDDLSEQYDDEVLNTEIIE